MRPIAHFLLHFYYRPFECLDAACGTRVAVLAIVLGAAVFSAASFAQPAETSLAVVNARISSTEDGPAVSPEYRFLPGDYLYFIFEVAGFAVQSENRGEIRKISLAYTIAAVDDQGRPLAEPLSDQIQTELNPEDKNWVPKRRASFLLPAFLAAGSFHVHTTVKDAFGKSESSRDFPFRIGGIQLQPAASITIENFRFLRNENDSEPLSVPAYSPGDTVFARFEMTGFHTETGNRHRVSYGVTVMDPSGKPFIQDPRAADLDEGGFYPAQFIPGTLALKMGKSNAHGQYTVIVKVRDQLAGQEFELKQYFSIE
jgi:hypothetical protein